MRRVPESWACVLQRVSPGALAGLSEAGPALCGEAAGACRGGPVRAAALLAAPPSNRLDPSAPPRSLLCSTPPEQRSNGTQLMEEFMRRQQQGAGTPGAEVRRRRAGKSRLHP